MKNSQDLYVFQVYIYTGLYLYIYIYLVRNGLKKRYFSKVHFQEQSNFHAVAWTKINLLQAIKMCIKVCGIKMNLCNFSNFSYLNDVGV